MTRSRGTPTQRTAMIVVNYRGCQDTLECLESVGAASPRPELVVVIDNGSDDGSVERIAEWGWRVWPGRVEVHLGGGDVQHAVQEGHEGSRLRLIRIEENLGFAGGVNTGLRYALAEDSFEYYWLLNNDTTIRPDALGALLQCAARTPGAGVIGATVVDDDHPERVQCAGGCRYSPLTTVFWPVLGGEPLERAIAVWDEPRMDYVYGAALFIRAEVLEQIGLLNEEYFLFYEELDFCRRATSAGYGLAWCRDSIIRHKCSRSVGPQSGKLSAAQRAKAITANYYENLSTLRFTQKFHPALLAPAMLFRFFGKLAAVSMRGQWFLVPPLVVAYRDFLRHWRWSAPRD